MAKNIDSTKMRNIFFIFFLFFVSYIASDISILSPLKEIAKTKGKLISIACKSNNYRESNCEKKSNREKKQKTDIKIKQKIFRKITLIIIEAIEKV